MNLGDRCNPLYRVTTIAGMHSFGLVPRDKVHQAIYLPIMDAPKFIGAALGIPAAVECVRCNKGGGG